MMYKIIVIFLAINFLIIPQKKDPDQILQKIVANFEKVKDYEVDVNIKVDVEFLKVPESNAKIFFKQPDKIALKSEGFAMLPKNGFNFSPAILLKDDYTSIYEKEEILNDHKTAVIKVIPLGTNADVILSTLWIDEEKNVIRKIESTTKINGTFTIDFSYDEKMNYPLPSKMVFLFNIDKMNLHSGMIGEPETKKKSKASLGSTITKGKVYVNYSNYKVNKGIPDSIFEEEIN
ncbi:MAG: hypothetical protein MUO34_02690 [Ignavibacteriaceae bacterium]|nr:hypothetical protein [Ignavibacteriaceae bacterium]